MKIPFEHLVNCIEEKPSLSELSQILFQLGHEHEIEDGILDMEFTPNRGDCLSVNGLLRDLAAFYTINLDQEIFNGNIKELQIDFENLSKNICPKISFLELEIDELPSKYEGRMNDYFEDLNLKKNNFFTDVSNYLSYESGQPTHCYDSRKLKGKLVFHETFEEEVFETLLDKNINLEGSNAVFSLNDKVINLAGVVGGKSTCCSKNTNKVIVECAYFEPEFIIGKSVKYDIQSDASYKFERGVDYNCQERILRRFIKIVEQHAKIIKISMSSFSYADYPIKKIPVDINKINKVIGMEITEENYLKYLYKLGFKSKKNYIQVPSHRNDIKSQNDLAEEVARVIGYDNISRKEINIPKNESKYDDKKEIKLKQFLLDNGFYEVINFPFNSSDDAAAIKVDNPLDSNKKFLRTNLISSLTQNLLFNERRQKDSIKLFEISDVYFNNDDICKKRNLCIIASGKVGLNYVDFSKKLNKKYLEKIFKEVMPNDNLVFHNISRESLDSKINEEIVYAEIDVSQISSDILTYESISKPPDKFNQYIPISELPSSYKDISYSITDYSKAQDLQDLLLNFKSEIIKDIFIFDYYKNEKTKEIKIGFRIIFQSVEATLISSEIDLIYNEIIGKSLEIEGISIPGL
tara:strand:- start:566 stop:2470 length:1905 start_codon:yes stop_codon:yes gene_type:complete